MVRSTSEDRAAKPGLAAAQSGEEAAVGAGLRGAPRAGAAGGSPSPERTLQLGAKGPYRGCAGEAA